jgi:hypothetical protein
MYKSWVIKNGWFSVNNKKQCSYQASAEDVDVTESDSSVVGITAERQSVVRSRCALAKGCFKLNKKSLFLAILVVTQKKSIYQWLKWLCEGAWVHNLENASS